MDDFSNSLIYYLNLIKTNNQELIQEATSAINEMKANPNYLQCLINIFSSSFDFFIKNQISILIKNYVTENLEYILNINKLFHCILELYINEKSKIIQSLFIKTLSILINEETVNILFEFIKLCLEEDNDNTINLIISLLCSVELSIYEVDHEVLSMLLKKGFETKDIKDTLIFSFKISFLLDDETYKNIWYKMVDIICDTFSDKLSLTILINKFISSFNENKFFDTNYLLSKLIYLIGDNEIQVDNQLLYASLIDNVFHVFYYELNLSHEFLQTIFYKFLKLNELIDNPLSFDLFSEISHICSKDIDFLSLIFENINYFYITENTKIGYLLILKHTLKNGIGFYKNHLNDLIKYFSLCINDKSYNVKEAASKAIIKFAKVFPRKKSLNEIIDYILNCLLIDYNPNFYECLSTLFTQCSSTDNNFKKANDLMIPLIKSSKSIILQHVVPCYVLMISNSKSMIHQYLNDIMDLFLNILISSSLEYSSIKEFIIEGIQNMSMICSELFEPYFDNFMNFLISQLETNNEDYMPTILVSIGKMIQKYPKFSQPYLQKIISFSLLIDDSNISQAFSTICIILDEFPELCETNMHLLYPYFQKMNDKDEDNLMTFCRGICILLSAIHKAELKDNDLLLQLLKWCYSIIEDHFDKFVVAEAISIVLEISIDFDPDFNLIFEIVKLAFNKTSLDNYIEEINDVLAILMKQLIHKVNDFSLFQEFIPTLFKMCKNYSFLEFALQILGQFTEKPAKGITHDFVNSVISIAIKAIEEENSENGVFVINQSATGCFSFISSYIDEILFILFNKLDNNDIEDSFLDNCVNAIGSIFIHSNRQIKFTVDNIKAILDHMPAQSLPDENKEMMNFYLILGESTNFILVSDFASVLIRLFSKSEEEIGIIDKIDELKQCLINLLQKIENPKEFCEIVCENNKTKLHFLNTHLFVNK